MRLYTVIRMRHLQPRDHFWGIVVRRAEGAPPSAIPWREMAAAGNFYRRNYEDVTPRRVWKTLQKDLSPLRAVIEQELASQV